VNIFQSIRNQINAFNKKNKHFILLKEPINDSLVSENDIQNVMEVFGFQLFTDIRSNYIDFLETAEQTDFHFIKQNGINGFAVDCFAYDLSVEEWRHIQVFCLQMIKNLQYVMHVNKVYSKSNQKQLVTTYKYYLKPSLKLMMDIPSEQLFGNISLELILQNSKPFRFLLHANYYSDRNYKKEKSFIQLLDFLDQA